VGLRELIVMLRYDSKQYFRVKQISGERQKVEGTKKNLLVIVFFAFVMLIVGGFSYFILAKLSLDIKQVIPLIGILFNFVFIMSIIGFIMTSVTSVHNVEKIEYLLVQPVSLKTIFAEKILLYGFYGSMLYFLIGLPIYTALAATYYPLLTPIFAIYFTIMTILVVIGGASIGGIFGLVIYKFLQGRRLLKQILSGLATAIAILIGSFYYVFIYSDTGNQFMPEILNSLIQLSSTFGLSSKYTIGYAMSNLLFSPFIGPDNILQIIFDIFLVFVLPLDLIYLNTAICEKAHYSGWITIGKRKEKKKTKRTKWNPHLFPMIELDPVVSVSAWYNIAMIKRESSVFVSYLLMPIRLTIFMLLPLFMGEEIGGLVIFLLIMIIYIFTSSYANSFAGYELVYEGKNFLNILSSGVDLRKYIKGKVYSAIPFSIIVGIIIGIICVILDFSLIPTLPIIIAMAIIITLVQGGVTSYYSSLYGNFKSDRLFLKQRGANIQPPIGFKGIILRFLVSVTILLILLGTELILILYDIVYAYIGLVFILIIAKKISNRYIAKAARKISELETTDYL